MSGLTEGEPKAGKLFKLVVLEAWLLTGSDSTTWELLDMRILYLPSDLPNQNF